jgi:S-disulfanyl-L-cysteine oxidoreductase SoxD
MFMSRWSLQSLTAIALCFAGTIHAEKEQFTSEVLLKAFAVPELGEPVSNEELRRIDFTVLPDGSGLPVGSGTAVEGAALYTQHCQACHGLEGQAGINEALSGGHGTLASSTPVKTVGSYWPYATTLFDYIRRAMPYAQPGKLTDDQTYALTAYVLFVNNVIPSTQVVDQTSLAGIVMPNRDGFVWSAEVKDLQMESN